jgi:lipoyl-dependent peroxiredoxin subunit D
MGIDALKDRIPEPAKDLKLNLGGTLSSEQLTKDQIWGIALSSAYYLRSRPLIDAVLEDAKANVGDAVIEDARAAASLMGMNTVFYRFRHLIGIESYEHRPARLRMQRIVQPATNKGDFELFCLAVAALAGCEACLKAHEASVKKHGLGEEQVMDAVRIAATLGGVAVALEV